MEISVLLIRKLTKTSFWSTMLWREALRISWKDYLREIEKNSVTGEWAKEVAQYLIGKEETKDVKES